MAAIKSHGTLNIVQYLSDEWISEANNRVKDLPALHSRLVIKYHVFNGPSGDRSYHLVFGPDEMAIVTDHPEPNVTFSLPWECATAIATGAVSAQRSFLDGTMTLTGDAATLIGHQETLTNVMDSLADLRDRTEYE